MATTDSGDSRPIPDPTALTTAQMHRAVAELRREMESWRADDKELIQSQFHAIDDKFNGVEARRKELKEDNKTAVEAALSAASGQRALLAIAVAILAIGVSVLVAFSH